MENYKAEFIEFMLECGVLSFGSFTLKSGRKSPYFVNTGKYCTGAQLYRLGDYYARTVYENCKLSEKTLLFGPAYKGIPLAAATAAALYKNHGADVRYCFNRKEAKDHGEGGVFVGATPRDGDEVVIIEDVITAGTALRETMPQIKSAANVDIAGMIISVNRMERMASGRTALDEVYDEFGFKVYSIVNVSELREYTADRLDEDSLSAMDEYMSQYCVI